MTSAAATTTSRPAAAAWHRPKPRGTRIVSNKRGSMDWRPNSHSVSRALLFAYPAEFREEYGADMDLLLSERAAGEPRLRIWLTLIGDVLRNAPREHWNL